MNIPNIPKLPDEVVKEAVSVHNDLTKPARVSIGETLGNIVDLVFGGLNTYVKKKRIDQELEVEYYKKIQTSQYIESLKNYLESTYEKVNLIPDNKLIEPQIDIVGPALEASKYYIENKIIREMFSNIISNSMNADMKDKVHHSYVEIVKQLSPTDCKNLMLFKKKSIFPIAQYIASSDNHVGSQLLMDNVFIPDAINLALNTNSISISNLHRLGIISITYDRMLTDNTAYNQIEHNEFLDECNEKISFYRELDTRFNELNTNNNYIYGVEITPGPKYVDLEASRILSINHSISITKGIVQLTPLGKSFVSICC